MSALVDITIGPDDEITVAALEPENSKHPDAWIKISSLCIWFETSADADRLAAAANEAAAFLKLIDR